MLITLCFFPKDLSGFTRLAEQLSKEGSAAPVNKKHIQIAMQSAENDSDTSFKWISGFILSLFFKKVTLLPLHP